MGEAYYIGMDIAKINFQVHGATKEGKKIYNRKLNRKNVLNFFAKIPKCIIAMEACGGAHYWGRELTKLGHDVRLIAPKTVKPFVINNKTDAADAEAICEVLRRPSTKFVPIKTEEQQLLMALHKIRERLIKNRTALANQIRGILYEFGITIPKGVTHLRKELAMYYEKYQENAKLCAFILELYDEFLEIDSKVKEIDKKIETVAKTHEDCKRLLKIPGVGPVIATFVVALVGKAQNYQNARQFAACFGLTPREHSSGGKRLLLGISKRGNSRLRSLLIQGALIIGRRWASAEAGNDRRKSWYQGVLKRRNKFVAAVAQANKTARIIYVVLARNEDYKTQLA